MDELKSSECSFYSVIANEYADASNSKQLAVCFRWLNNDLHAHEDFIGLYPIPDISANTIESLLQDALIRLQLLLDECRGQFYDRASNILSKNSSVATKIQEKQSKGFPRHSHCHSFSLSVKALIKESKLFSDATDMSKEIVILIKVLLKKEAILDRLKKS